MISKAELCRRFGQRLKALRKKRGFSQEGFAMLTGLDRSYVGGMEQGRRNPTICVLCQLAEILAVDPSELVQDISAAEWLAKEQAQPPVPRKT